MKHRWFYILLITCFIAQQCAKQTAPTGGAKDETPPILVRSNPTHKEVDFKGKEIQLTFNELIQLNNPREQILITPTIGKKFEATVKKNKVTIQLNAKLHDSTTYSFNFRESIQDITERNSANTKLAFSTGPYIDSLSVTGKIKDILTDKELTNYTVALTPISDTFNIFKHTAPWITLTDKKGRFALENLKQGTYLLYAFDDKNKNLVVDSKSEKYGFKKDNINLQGPIDSITVQAFKLDAAKLKLITSRPTFAYYNIRFSKSIVNYKLSPIDTTRKLYSTVETDLATIKVFNTIPDLDSLQLHLEAIDSTDSKVDTLIYIKFQKKESTKDKFSGKIDLSNIYESNSTLSAVLSFTKPVVLFFQDSLFLQVDSLNRVTFTKKNDITWNENLTRLTIHKKLELPKREESQPKNFITKSNIEAKPTKISKPNNQLILKKGAVVSVENDSLSELTTVMKMIRPEDFGIISTKVSSKENFILQLVDRSNKVIEQVENIATYNFENIPPGTYLLRLLVDLNKNGKWDGGNFSTKNQPEPVQFYHNPKGGKEIMLKANWHVGPLLITH